MSAPRKLTDEQIQSARTTIAKRRAAQRVLTLYPTLTALANQLGVTPRYLRAVINGRARAERSARKDPLAGPIAY